MGAITPTKVVTTEFSGKNKVFTFTCTPASASDTVTLSASNGIRTIKDVIAVVSAGQDANLMTAHATFSGLVITIVTIGADGGNATDWTGAVVKLWVIGE